MDSPGFIEINFSCKGVHLKCIFLSKNLMHRNEVVIVPGS